MGLFGSGGGGKKKVYMHYLSWFNVICAESVDCIRTIYMDEKPVWGAGTDGNSEQAKDNTHESFNGHIHWGGRPDATGNAPAQDIEFFGFGGTRHKGGDPSRLFYIDEQYKITDNTNMWYDNNECFGGKDGEGGIAGGLWFFFGKPDQIITPVIFEPMNGNDPAQLSSYRGVTSIAFRNFYIGTSAYLKTMGVLVTRIFSSYQGKAQWYPEKAQIGEFDMNPVHIIREFLTSTNPDWGFGLDDSTIDDANFRAVADALHNEGFGLSFIYESDTSGSEFIESILYHINGVLIEDRRTGKRRIKLVRDDYDYNTLRKLNKDEIVEVSEFKISDTNTLVNQINLTYWDRARRKKGTIPIQNPALYDLMGVVNAKNITFEGCCTEELAQRLAMRELQSACTPLISLKVKFNRLAFNLELGDVVRIDMFENNIPDVAYRVIEITYDEEFNYIDVRLIQDIYGYPKTIVSNKPVNNTMYYESPKPMVNYLVFEPTYYDLANRYSAAEADRMLNQTTFAVTGERQGAEREYIVGKVENNEVYNAGAGNFRDVSELLQGVEPTNTTITPNGYFAVSVGEIIQIDDERMLVVGSAGSTLTVSRGMNDTHIARHNKNAKIYIVSNTYIYEDSPLPVGGNIQLKLITATPYKFLPFAQAPVINYSLTGRQHLPLPPKNIKFNGELEPTLLNESTVISFAKRNRKNDNVDWFSDVSDNEQDVKYYITVKDQSNLEIVSKTEMVNTPYALTLPDDATKATITLWSERAGIKSKFDYSKTFNVKINTVYTNYWTQPDPITWSIPMTRYQDYGSPEWWARYANYYAGTYTPKYDLVKGDNTGFKFSCNAGNYKGISNIYNMGVAFYKDDTLLNTVWSKAVIDNTVGSNAQGGRDIIVTGVIPSEVNKFAIVMKAQKDDVERLNNAFYIRRMVLELK